MTNLEIIATEAMVHELYTEEELMAFYDEKEIMPLNTYKMWDMAGYQVKKGEKAKIQTRLWKKNPKYRPMVTEEEIQETEADEVKKQRAFYLTKAYLFDISQVEKKAN